MSEQQSMHSSSFIFTHSDRFENYKGEYEAALFNALQCEISAGNRDRLYNLRFDFKERENELIVINRNLCHNYIFSNLFEIFKQLPTSAERYVLPCFDAQRYVKQCKNHALFNELVLITEKYADRKAEQHFCQIQENMDRDAKQNANRIIQEAEDEANKIKSIASQNAQREKEAKLEESELERRTILGKAADEKRRILEEAAHEGQRIIAAANEQAKSSMSEYRKALEQEQPEETQALRKKLEVFADGQAHAKSSLIKVADDFHNQLVEDFNQIRNDLAGFIRKWEYDAFSKDYHGIAMAYCKLHNQLERARERADALPNSIDANDASEEGKELSRLLKNFASIRRYMAEALNGIGIKLETPKVGEPFDPVNHELSEDCERSAGCVIQRVLTPGLIYSNVENQPERLYRAVVEIKQ